MKEVIFYTNFWIRRVVKLGVKKVKRLTIWDWLSSFVGTGCWKTMHKFWQFAMPHACVLCPFLLQHFGASKGCSIEHRQKCCFCNCQRSPPNCYLSKLKGNKLSLVLFCRYTCALAVVLCQHVGCTWTPCAGWWAQDKDHRFVVERWRDFSDQSLLK